MNQNEKIKCTVSILTFNAEKGLKRLLPTVKNFDDIIICDGGSTDGTLSVAQAAGCRILHQDSVFKRADNRIKDFSGVRNQMITAAKYQWFLYVDSDEFINQELEQEIASIINGNKPAVYFVPRKYILKDKVIECATTYPNKQMRFFHLSLTEGFIKPIHERISLKQSVTSNYLKNAIFVPIESSAEEIKRKHTHYIGLEVARSPHISCKHYISICYKHARISALYVYRWIRNFIFCRGERLPFAYEWAAHVYHFKLCLALLKNVECFLRRSKDRKTMR